MEPERKNFEAVECPYRNDLDYACPKDWLGTEAVSICRGTLESIKSGCEYFGKPMEATA